MSENELEKKLADEREKVRLNSIKMLKLLGYTQDPSKLNQEQLEARIELLLEQRKNAEIEATKNGDVSKPALFKGIDGERENKEAVQNAAPSELDLSEYMKGYDALTAHIQLLRPNSQVGHMESLAARENIRIIRLPASIRLNEHTSIMRRVVL
jgi:hypothetical protein